MRRPPLSALRRRLRAATRNALELARVGRLSAAQGTPYAVVDHAEHHKLRRYETAGNTRGPVALLIPPLMVTAEIYDVAPDVSAVSALASRGIIPYVVDFGAPEHEKGGLTRTLDDHIRAVLRSVERVHALEGRPIHLLGYSQGGMFAYQAAAYLRSEKIRSLITFGSPVDIHRNLPALRSDVTGALVELLEPALRSAFSHIEALPGVITSTGFKIVSGRKEIQQRIEFLKLLHDRGALERREARRRFLGGEGFVAWPGPAFRAFVEDFIVHNRMLSGGFVIDGRTVTLADLTCPILAFVGTTDEIARPPTIHAIVDAAPEAEVTFCPVRAGHFGLVVGSRAMSTTWPTVAEWMHYREGSGPKPGFLADKEVAEPDEFEGDFDVDLELLFGALGRSAKNAWKRMGDVASSASDTLDAVRYQEPRLRRLLAMSSSTRVSPGRALADAAAKTPEATFFMWRDRAFTYRDADTRVTNVARGLYQSGVRQGDRVLVVMGSRPSFLTMVTALSRLGAVPVIAPPNADARALAASAEELEVKFVASDPEHGARAHEALCRPIFVLGGGGGARALPRGLVDLEALEPPPLPGRVNVDPGVARDLAMILLRPENDGLRAAPVTHHRWALSAYGAAAACTLKPSDTVHCAVPLHHPTGILASVGAALVGGARLALDERFDPTTFLAELRRVGATVVFYAGEMLRPLLALPPGRGDHSLPVRVFAGSGMRAGLAARLEERFGVGTMEFYASTSRRVIFANASGAKPGALGRPLPGSARVELVRCDWTTREPHRDALGRVELAAPDEAGLLVVRLDADDVSDRGLLEGAFVEGDRWGLTGDVLRFDDDGDYRFVDALSGFVDTPGGPVSLRAVEDALYTLPGVEMAAAYADGARIVGVIVADGRPPQERCDAAFEALPEHGRPAELRLVAKIAMTEGYRPDRTRLR